MDKDKIGLVKYIILIMAISFLPLLECIIFLILFMFSRVVTDETLALANIILILFIVVPIIYFFSIIFITAKAIKNHWSCHLDKFLSNRKLLTLIFFLNILIIYFHYLLDNWIWNYLLFCFAPTYIIVYITTLFLLQEKN